MRYLDTPIDDTHVVVFTSRALAACAAETMHHGGNETGGLFLGHRCGPIWYVIEAIDPGPKSNHAVAAFQYDQDYLNHLMNKLRWYYEKPLDLLGLWHRHPGSFDRFSHTDRGTHRRFLQEKPEGILSMLVNVDPELRLTAYEISKTDEWVLPSAVGSDLIPPFLSAYRGAGSPSTLWHPLSLAFIHMHRPQVFPLPDTRLEDLLQLTESDLQFLSLLCGPLTMRVGEQEVLEVWESGQLLLRFKGNQREPILSIGQREYPYYAGGIQDTWIQYTLSRAKGGVWPKHFIS